MLAERLHTARSFLRHQLTAWNTGGEGIHSPSLFYLVRMIIYDDNAYYAFDEIERHRAALQRNHPDVRQVSVKTGRLLFRLVNYLSQTQQEPLTIVEAGHAPGMSTWYLSTPTERNIVVCCEKPEDDCPKRVDLVYVAGEPTCEAMLRDCRRLLPRMTNHSILVISGIHRTKESEQVWQAIQAEKQVTSTLDLYSVGIVLFNKHYIRKHYKLRF